MKLRSLEILNIASYAHAVVDFDAEPLVSAPVILIAGKVGAGKSTILDAITLALYGRTARMDATGMKSRTADNAGEDRGIRANDVRQLIRQGQRDAEVRLSFTANDGRTYSAVWQAHITRNGTYSAAKRWLRMPDGSEISKLADINERIRALVGLDFAQFCRTTMLAQGEFTRFLKSDDNEKAEILEKITGCAIYSRISQRIFEKTRQRREAVEKIAARIAELRSRLGVDDSEGFSVADRLTNARREADVAEKEAYRLTAIQRYRRQVAELTAQSAAADKALEAAVEHAASPEVAQARSTITDYDACARARSLLTEIEVLRSNVSAARKSVDEAAASYRTLKAMRDEIHLRRPLESLTAVRDFLALRLQSYDHSALEAERSRLGALQLKISALDKDRETLAGLCSERDAKRLAAERCRHDIATADSAVSAAQAEHKVAKSVCDTAAESVEMARDTVDKHTKAMRARLSVGARCPVCDRILTELPRPDDYFNELYKKLVDRKKECADALAAVETRLNTARVDAASARKNLKRLDEEISRTDTRISALTAQCSEAAAALRQAVPSAASDSDIPAIVAAGTDAVVASMSRHDRLRALLAEADARIARAQRRADIDSTLADIRKLCPGIADARATQCSRHTFAHDPAGRTFYGRLSQIVSKSEGDLVLIADKQHLIAEFCADEYPISPERLSALTRLSDKELAAFRRTVSDSDGNIARCRAVVDSTRSSLEALAAPEGNENAGDDNTLAEALESANRRRDAAQQLIGRLVKLIDDSRRIEDEIDSLEKQHADADAEYRRWAVLNAELGSGEGDKFRKIAQSFVLQALLSSANVYLSQLADRYRLRGQPGTYNIDVEDALSGTAPRSANTVSGGESFLVSLSLALALSDISPKLAVDILFIDEGFGSLSGEPLANAVDLLRTLHKRSGRRVAIISHIPRLSECIDTRISVDSDPASGISSLSIIG